MKVASLFKVMTISLAAGGILFLTSLKVSARGGTSDPRPVIPGYCAQVCNLNQGPVNPATECVERVLTNSGNDLGDTRLTTCGRFWERTNDGRNSLLNLRAIIGE